MVGLDEAMTRCREIEGFEDQESHRILLEWAEKVKSEAFERKDTSNMTQAEREEYANVVLRKAVESRNIKHLKAAIRDAKNLEEESMRIYVCRDSPDYMDATQTLLEVEGDVKEKFAAAQKSNKKVEVEDKYYGSSMIEQMNVKFARDQLRKAITSMDGDELDAALEVCLEIPGFRENEANQILLARAEKVREEAFERKDTSNWAQADREQYTNLVLQKAHESRNIKHLKAAIRDAKKLEEESDSRNQ